MYPLLHALTGTLAFPFTKRRTLDFVLCLFFGILPDFDIIFPTSWTFLAHRNFTHTIFPFAIILGIITLFYFKSFLLGFLPITFHYFGDLFGSGKVAIVPYVWTDWNIVPNQLMFSSVIAAIILTCWVGYFIVKEVKKSETVS